MQNLTDISDKNPFRIPENYLEEINARIISATSGYQEGVVKRGFFNRWKPYILVAASVAGFAILGYTALKLSSSFKAELQQVAVITNDTSNLYPDDIDILMLEESASSLVFAGEGSDVNKSDIIDYLILDDIGIDEIYEQL